MKLVAIDFDGVLHQYKGWDDDPPKGKPVPGVTRALRLLRAAGFDLIVFSARNGVGIQEWLRTYDLLQYFRAVTNTKPKEAVAFFDDRAWRVETNRHGGLGYAVRDFLAGQTEIPEEGLPPVLAPPVTLDGYNE